jgi:hypothetical protein
LLSGIRRAQLRISSPAFYFRSACGQKRAASRIKNVFFPASSCGSADVGTSKLQLFSAITSCATNIVKVWIRAHDMKYNSFREVAGLYSFLPATSLFLFVVVVSGPATIHPGKP